MLLVRLVNVSFASHILHTQHGIRGLRHAQIALSQRRIQAEKGQKFKLKHTANSRAQLGPTQQALAMVHTLAEDFANEVAALCATNVNDRQWQQFLDQHVPRTDDACKPLDGRSRTLADAKRDHLTQLYRSDPRVAPWAGTAHGVARRASRWWR